MQELDQIKLNFNVNKSRPRIKKTSFKKQVGRSYKKLPKKSMRKQENLHKLLPSILIQTGDRVRVRGKHNGIVKYIGRIVGSTSPDIYVGVQLDEPVTKGSGLYKGRQYFDCPFGYGIMISYNQVQKINVVQKLVPAMKPAGRPKNDAKEPYLIKRWKSASGPDMTVGLETTEKKKSENKANFRHKLEKSATDPHNRKYKIPDLTQLSPTVERRREREFEKIIHAYNAENTNMLLGDVCRPNPYPSTSALQQSFAKICDTYSSSDSGFAEAYNPKIPQEDNRNSFARQEDPIILLQNNRPRNLTEHIRVLRTKSLPRDLDVESDDTYRFIHARTFPATTRAAFGNRGYYVANDKMPLIERNSQSPDRLSETDYCSDFFDHRKSLNAIAPAWHTVVGYGGAYPKQEKQRGRSRMTSNVEKSGNSLQRRQPKRDMMIRAKSIGEGLGQLNWERGHKTVLKDDLIEWRRKFGENNANKMISGLQKLQDAFAKGMNLKETYGYPTSTGRYVKLAK